LSIDCSNCSQQGCSQRCLPIGRRAADRPLLRESPLTLCYFARAQIEVQSSE
jgi:hypothetical protein